MDHEKTKAYVLYLNRTLLYWTNDSNPSTTTTTTTTKLRLPYTLFMTCDYSISRIISVVWGPVRMIRNSSLDRSVRRCASEFRIFIFIKFRQRSHFPRTLSFRWGRPSSHSRISFRPSGFRYLSLSGIINDNELYKRMWGEFYRESLHALSFYLAVYLFRISHEGPLKAYGIPIKNWGPRDGRVQIIWKIDTVIIRIWWYVCPNEHWQWWSSVS